MKDFAELSGKETSVELMRWMLVPVTAVLCVLVLRLIAGIAMPPALAQPPGTPVVPPPDFQRMILPRVFGILMAAAFVIVGARTAPRWRVATAIVLAVLWIFYCFLVFVVVHLGRGKPHYMDFVVGAGAAAGGVVYVWYTGRVNSERRSQQADGEY